MKVVREFYKPLTCELGVIAEFGLRLTADAGLISLYGAGLRTAAVGAGLLGRGWALSSGLAEATSFVGPWWNATFVGPNGAVAVLRGRAMVGAGAAAITGTALGVPQHGGFSLWPVNFINFAFSRPFDRC